MANAAAYSRSRRVRRTIGVLALLLVGVPQLPARADPVSALNTLRASGCAQAPAASSAARRNATLDAAARELARNASLERAFARVGYPVATSTSFRVRGSTGDDAIRAVLAERYCAAVNNPAFVEAGFHQSGDSTWIVMASRAESPFAALGDPAAVAQRVLELVNAARAEARVCGRDRYAAAGPLALTNALISAALLHSSEMARLGTLSHRGADGSNSGERITRAGYTWQASGENVAAGQRDADAVVAAWLQSPGHCATLMNPHFTETGIAFALAAGKNPPIYWTQVFAAPL